MNPRNVYIKEQREYICTTNTLYFQVSKFTKSFLSHSSTITKVQTDTRTICIYTLSIIYRQYTPKHTHDQVDSSPSFWSLTNLPQYQWRAKTWPMDSSGTPLVSGTSATAKAVITTSHDA